MQVKVHLFAVLRDRLQRDAVELSFVEQVVSVDEIRERFRTDFPDVARVFGAVRVAVNHEFVSADFKVRLGDEVALIPPVSGGCGRAAVRISGREVSAQEVEAVVRHDGAGAVVTFLGTVRNKTDVHEVLALEYEVYEKMALGYLAKIKREVEDEFEWARVAIIHRKGRVEIGEPSVAIAVSHPHRDQAFKGCRHVIERLKEDVPIWKKEIRADGSVWVGVGS